MSNARRCIRSQCPPKAYIYLNFPERHFTPDCSFLHTMMVAPIYSADVPPRRLETRTIVDRDPVAESQGAAVHREESPVLAEEAYRECLRSLAEDRRSVQAVGTGALPAEGKGACRWEEGREACRWDPGRGLEACHDRQAELRSEC